VKLSHYPASTCLCHASNNIGEVCDVSDFLFYLNISVQKGTLLFFSLSKHEFLTEKVSIYGYLWRKMRKNVF